MQRRGKGKGCAEFVGEFLYGPHPAEPCVSDVRTYLRTTSVKLTRSEISYRPLRGRYEEGPSKGASISQVPVSPVSSRLLPASGCNRG